MTRKRITSKSFHAINRTIKEQVAAGKYKAEKVAKLHNVGVSTVRAIKVAKTWPGYQRAKTQNLQRRTLQGQSTIPIKNGKWTKLEGAPVGEKVYVPATKPKHSPNADKQLQMDLEDLKTNVPRAEFEAALRHVHERIDVLSATYRELRRSTLFRLLFGARVGKAIHRQDMESFLERIQERKTSSIGAVPTDDLKGLSDTLSQVSKRK